MVNVRILPTLIFAVIMLLSSCSLSTTAVRVSEPLLLGGVDALYRETDVEFARQALPGNLKLIEGFRASDPANATLNLLLAQGYAAYALGYLEDEDTQRTRNFYFRAWEYAALLFPADSPLRNGHTASLEQIRDAAAGLAKDDTDRLFWLALSWGSFVNFSISDPEYIADLSKIEVLMQRVIDLDESYYYGGAHMFFGVVAASVPVMLGGQPDKALYHFNRAREINGDKFLFTRYFFAKTYAYQIQDRELFVATLRDIIAADSDILPGMELPNALAQMRAKRLLKEADILF
jgi:tetratricopeptide (TPR) repeat protein